MQRPANVDGAKVKALREAANLTQEALGELAGVSGAHISRIENGKRPSNEVATLTALASALSVDPSELLAPVEISGRAEGRATVKGVLTVKPPPHPLWVDVPFYGPVPAGTPIVVEEAPAETLSLRKTWLRGAHRPYCVTASGESMEPIIYDGDLLIIDPDFQPVDGVIIIAQVDHATTVKRLRIRDGLPYLEPINERYDTIPPRQETHYKGRVVKIIREIDP